MTSDGSTERFRLFVAITVPGAVRNEMVRVQRELQPLAPRGVVRWTKPEQFHLTLRFLGDVASNDVADLREAIRLVCSDKPVLHLYARGVGFFPNARSPRVIWVGAGDAANHLLELQKEIETAVCPFTTEQGSEHFVGHVTLGRFKHFNRPEIGELTATAKAMENRRFGHWTAREVEVVKSELSRTGTVYTRLAACPLGAKIEPT
jgi:RNA 2',3'-cyclic 3'-phosphodiesterase